MTNCPCNYCRFGVCPKCRHPEPVIEPPLIPGFRPLAVCQCGNKWTNGGGPIVDGIPEHKLRFAGFKP